MLRPISFEALDTTLPILSRGFPGMRPERWAQALVRLRRFGAARPTERAGYLMGVQGRDVGVILAIPSARPHGSMPGQTVVNLSSWYIDPEHRWRAPRMLQSVTGCSATLYTDLTSTPSVRTMIGRLGFRDWTEGTLLCPLPLYALRSAGSAHIVAMRDLPADAFEPPVRQMLEQHAGLDCICGALWDGASLQPLIFSRKPYRGLSAARLAFAGNRSAVLAHLPAIARFLLREKILLLAINADRSERIAGTLFTQRTAPTFYKGPSAPARGDFAFSEFVFLQI